jgi:hypothetical protein
MIARHSCQRDCPLELFYRFAESSRIPVRAAEHCVAT